NIRELRNMMERAALLCSDGVVELEHLPLEKMKAQFGRPAPLEAEAPDEEPGDPLAAEERRRIIEALEQCAGNQTHAARMLGMAGNTLLGRLEAYKLPRPRKRQ